MAGLRGSAAYGSDRPVLWFACGMECSVQSRLFVSALLTIALVGCLRSGATQIGRFHVTADPIDIGPNGARFCLAVDPGDPHGVWWWEPGRSGCSSRSTGPDVFRGDAGTVSRRDDGSIDVYFRIQLIQSANATSPPYGDVRFFIRDGRLQPAGSGRTVAMARRRDLEIPERP